MSDLGQRGIDGSGHGMRATQKIWLQVWRVVHIGQQGLVTHCQKQCQMNHVITRRLNDDDDDVYGGWFEGQSILIPAD